MSLRWYRRPRLVVLRPDRPILEAARALERNRIGAVVVQYQGRVVGIITDRDLAVRALGRERDPEFTRIADVMTPDPVTLRPADGVEDAVRLMQEHNIRRIPLVEGERVVGMVTLDDLLLDEAAPGEALAAIVEAQIAEGGPAPSARNPAHRRSLARTEATLLRLLNKVGARTGLDDPEGARAALDVVLAAIVRRLTPREADDLIAQLPSLLQPGLRALPPGPDKRITAASIEAEIGERLGVDPREAAEILPKVAGVIAAGISEGQAEDVRQQLPAGLRDAFRYSEPEPLFI